MTKPTKVMISLGAVLLMFNIYQLGRILEIDQKLENYYNNFQRLQEQIAALNRDLAGGAVVVE